MHSDLVVLSSSPGRNATCAPPPSFGTTEKPLQVSAHSSSSSPVPSPSELLRPPSRSRFFACSDHNRSEPEDGIKKGTFAGKTATGNSKTTNLETTQKRRGRKPKTAPLTTLCDLDFAAVENENPPTKPKRTRKKRDDVGTEGKLRDKKISGRVEKTGSSRLMEAGAKPVDGPPTPEPTRQRSAGEQDIHGHEADDLQLEPALKRRLDWTPTKDLAISAASLDGGDGAEGARGGLGALLSSYEYDISYAISDRPRVLADNVPTKRRRIELVESKFLPLKPKPSSNDIDSNSDKDARPPATSKPNKKPKPRAKRLTTLTARVTASYLRDHAEILESADGDVLDKPKALTDMVVKTCRTKKKADIDSGFKVPRTIVLSPEAAVKSLDNQDLIFGTCSQLQQEDSPILPRAIQVTHQESEEEMPPICSLRPGSSRVRAPSATVSRLTAPGSMWSVAARDSDGLLKDVEVVELIDTPEAPKTITLPHEDDNEQGAEQRETNETVSERGIQAAETSFSDGSLRNKQLPASNTRVDEPRACSTRRMPNYLRWKDTTLAREIKRNGLKAIKSRKKMIEVLEKCWAAKHGPSGKDKDVTASAQNTTMSAPQKSEKQSRKLQPTSQINKPQPKPTDPQLTKKSDESAKTPDADHTASDKHTQPTSTRSFIDVEEIRDSEDESLPSPSRLQSQLFNLPRGARHELPTSTIASSPSGREQTTPLTAASKHAGSLPELGDQITKAVRAQPRQGQAGPSSRPSWLEKILMYDPIYLEDFTAWLNTGGLGLVDEDREVGAVFVRQWCESKGICCCYKSNYLPKKKTKKKGGHN
ncbi:protein slx4 [Aspergillus lucknowensis]|uniref:Structure-specific endonuclease subunit SLX4 n=1 Tax=Aspergillus lucknowensis TaxID=176173 RepID=A0ABR4LTY2_9EURO